MAKKRYARAERVPIAGEDAQRAVPTLDTKSATHSPAPSTGEELWDAAIVGGGLAGLSAAVYLGRSHRRALLFDTGESMARWEPEVENYLGFPEAISGQSLLEKGRAQARRFGVQVLEARIDRILREEDSFVLVSGAAYHRSRRVLLATGLTHLLPEIPGADACLGRTVFFCKDCDAYRVQGKRIAIYGRRNEAARYALAMLAFSPSVTILTDGRGPAWDAPWQASLGHYDVSVRTERIKELAHRDGHLTGLIFQEGPSCDVDAMFTTRGDVFHTALAEGLGAEEDEEGQLMVDEDMRTTVSGLYAAGCLTPANCQMVIAAGQGATAAQAIDRDLFSESLRRHALPRFDRALVSKGIVK
ncbi:MAG: putative Thioredoxin reductase [Nitrospira sp.]|nr:putative Thioredoxin reductase [Nitrospira sp.]